MCTVERLRVKISAHSNRIVAKSLNAETFASMNLVAPRPFAATEFDRKIRILEISPTKEISWPGLASQYDPPASLTSFTAGWLITLFELWAREA